MMLNTKEMAAIFNALHASYDLKVEQNGETLSVESFMSKVDGDDLEFIIKVHGAPLDDRDIEIIQLKKENKCLIEELERVKIELLEVKG